MDPHDPESWCGLGRIRFTQQRFQEAVACFKQALLLAPHSVKAENNLGLSYEGLNHPVGAGQAYRQAIAWQHNELHPTEQPFLNLGSLLVHLEKLAEGCKLLERAVEIAPREFRTREQLGHVYLQMGKPAQAKEQLRSAVNLEPKNAALHFLLGRVYHQEGDEAEVKPEFATASALSGYHSTPAYCQVPHPGHAPEWCFARCLFRSPLDNTLRSGLPFPCCCHFGPEKTVSQRTTTFVTLVFWKRYGTSTGHRIGRDFKRTDKRDLLD